MQVPVVHQHLIRQLIQAKPLPALVQRMVLQTAVIMLITLETRHLQELRVTQTTGAIKAVTAYSYNCGRYCFLASCGAAACNSQPTGTTPPSNTCDSTKRDTPASNEITFAKTGKIIPFMRNPYTGTITLSKTGSSDIVIPFIKGNAVELTSFSVKAGDKYTIKTRISTESKNAYGWIPNKSTNLCGPVKTPGDPLDGNSKPTGKCGEEVDIKAVRTLAESKVDFAGITASGKSASIQCWGDAALGDSTQDYDYNDFTIIFGYEKSTEVGACVNMKIYKKVADVYSSTALTVAQLQTLKVGDVLKFTVDGSIVGLKGRFRVTIDDVPGEWLTPTISSNGTMNIYTDYAVAKAGT